MFIKTWRLASTRLSFCSWPLWGSEKRGTVDVFRASRGSNLAPSHPRVGRYLAETSSKTSVSPRRGCNFHQNLASRLDEALIFAPGLSGGSENVGLSPLSEPLGAASEASEAIKRLQFHSFETTFGASEAPGHGASIYDGLKADFVIDSTKNTRFGPTWGDPGSNWGDPGPTWDDPGSTRAPHVRMSACPHVRMSPCPHVDMSTCGHVRMCACPHVHMSTCPHVHMCACPHVQMPACYML